MFFVIFLSLVLLLFITLNVWFHVHWNDFHIASSDSSSSSSSGTGTNQNKNGAPLPTSKHDATSSLASRSNSFRSSFSSAASSSDNNDNDDVGDLASLHKLPNHLHLPAYVGERSDEVFTCENMSLLRLLDTKPFATGWNKEIWKATWPENNNKLYSIKRRFLSRAKSTQDLAKKKAYGFKLLQREHELLRQLHHWNLLISYGGCVSEEFVDADAESDRVALVTEYFESYTMQELLRQTLPWCVWTKLAIDFAMIIKFLDQTSLGPFVHCDWKASQFIVRKKDYRVVLVDVDSLQKYERNHTFLDDVRCDTIDIERLKASDKKHSLLHLSPCATLAGECFQEEARSSPVPDASCDAASGRCRGFDSRSMLWSFGGGLLLDMLGGKLEMFYNNNNNNHNDNADVFVFNGRNPDMEKATRLYIETIGDIVKNITQTERSLRWDVETVLKTLRSLFNRLEGKRCMTRWQWHIRSE